ncbi:unnamed protein product [Symbiodinium sp. KB8]|nr:unnamed protein product [Symbiodinium sp. KB8]
MASSSESEKEWRAPDKKEEPKTPPQEPEEEYVEVTVEAEPTPPSSKGQGSLLEGQGAAEDAAGESSPEEASGCSILLQGRWSAYPRKRKGKQQKAKTESKSTQTPEIMTVMGHAERHEKLEEEAKAFAQLLERHSSPNQYEARFPQVDLSIAAGRAEVTTRAVVVITDKTSYTSPMPTHRQHPPPPPPPDVTMADPAGTVPGSPSSFSFVTAPKTPDAGTAAVETPAPSSPPPATTLNIGKKARTEEPKDREIAVASASAPASPPPTRLATRAAKASSPSGEHRLPPGVTWDDL